MEAQNGEESTPEDVNVMVPAELYLRKYLALQRRCEQVQQTNERLINRLQHIKKTIRKFKKERKFLMEKLDDYGDPYHEATIPYPWEETSPYGSGMPPSSSTAIDESLIKTEPVDVESFAPPSVASNIKGIKIEPGSEPATDVVLPKKPANAFILFCQKQRPIMQEEYRKEQGEDLSHQDLSRQLALLWNGLPQEKKQVYYDLYEQDKVRYEEELQQLSGRDATSSLPPPAGGSIVDVVEGHQRNPGLDAALLLMDPSLIKTEPMSIP